MSWLGPDKGWALVGEPCKRGSCARVVRTTDAGGQWQALGNPEAELANGSYECQRQACVSGVSFASRRVGYLYGPGLLMTADGGTNWHRQRGLQVEALEIAGRSVFRVAYKHLGCPGPCQPIVQTAAVGSSSWRTVIGRLVVPDRSGTAQILSSGSTVLVALYGSQAGPVPAYASVYRSASGGRSWRKLPDPCTGLGPHGSREEEDLTAVAAAPNGVFAGLCTPHVGIGRFVITSTTAGRSWRKGGAVPRTQFSQLIAAASSTTLAVSTGPSGGAGTFTAKLLVSTDAGQHWKLMATDHQRLGKLGAPAWLGFQNATTGRWIGDPHGIWTTHEPGRSWTRASFR